MSAKKVYRFKAYNGVTLLPSQISKSLQIVLLYIDQLNANCIVPQSLYSIKRSLFENRSLIIYNNNILLFNYIYLYKGNGGKRREKIVFTFLVSNFVMFLLQTLKLWFILYFWHIFYYDKKMLATLIGFLYNSNF